MPQINATIVGNIDEAPQICRADLWGFIQVHIIIILFSYYLLIMHIIPVFLTYYLHIIAVLFTYYVKTCPECRYFWRTDQIPVTPKESVLQNYIKRTKYTPKRAEKSYQNNIKRGKACNMVPNVVFFASGRGNGQSHFQTFDPVRFGIFQIHFLQRLWRFHA